MGSLINLVPGFGFYCMLLTQFGLPSALQNGPSLTHISARTCLTEAKSRFVFMRQCPTVIGKILKVRCRFFANRISVPSVVSMVPHREPHLLTLCHLVRFLKVGCRFFANRIQVPSVVSTVLHRVPTYSVHVTSSGSVKVGCRFFANRIYSSKCSFDGSSLRTHLLTPCHLF